jgi:hypothetical protein
MHARNFPQPNASLVEYRIPLGDSLTDTRGAGIRRAGGEVADARWAQREAPYTSLIVASLPTATALEAYCSIQGNEDEIRLSTRYAADGVRRRLTMEALLPDHVRIPDDSTRPRSEAQQDKANGISEMRIVVIGGGIQAAQGWVVASDRRSALLSLDEVARLHRDNPDRIELFIEWLISAPSAATPRELPPPSPR